MNSTDIQRAANEISKSIHLLMRGGHLARIDFDSVKCAVAGYLVASPYLATTQQVEDLENLALRKFVEACA